MRVNVNYDRGVIVPITQEQHQHTGIIADLLIPGRGNPIPNGSVIIEDASIKWMGQFDEMPSSYKSLNFIHVPVLMPGLWDAHVHYLAGHVLDNLGFSSRFYLPGSAALVGAIIVNDLRETLMAGFTSVRELEGYAGDVRPAIEAGLISGPNVYSSIMILTTIGGHGDDHLLPLETVCCTSSTIPKAVCTGPVECVRKVREAVRRGAKVIKVCSSGGVLSYFDQPEEEQFSLEELRAIVEEAARLGVVVAAHAIGKGGIISALEAGVKTIDHGYCLDLETATLMKEKDAILVPTRHIIETLADTADQLPLVQRVKLERMLSQSRSSLRLAVREKVKISLGTDTFSSDQSSGISHGKNAKELYWATVAGMSNLEAIEACTAISPETLGPKAPLSGQIKSGYDADLIALSSNPLDDITILGMPEKVTHVWKGGKLVKSPSS